MLFIHGDTGFNVSNIFRLGNVILVGGLNMSDELALTYKLEVDSGMCNTCGPLTENQIKGRGQ